MMLRVLVLLVVGTAVAVPTWAEDQAEEAPERAMAAIRAHAVSVAFSFQRDVDAEERGAVPPDPKGTAELYRLWRMSWRVPGFVFRDRRTVLVSDPWFSRGAIETIRVRTPDGFEATGTLVAHLRDVEGAIVRTDAELPVEPLTFAEAAAGPATFVGSVAEGPDGLDVWLEDLRRMRRRPLGADGGTGFGSPDSPRAGLVRSGDDGARSVDLVTDAAGTPMGFRFGAALDAAGRWRGPAVLASPTLALDDVEALETSPDVKAPLHRLTVTYRAVSRHDRTEDPYGFGRRDTPEQELWGLAVAPDLLLVPTKLEERQIRRVASIRLEDDDAPDVKAVFAGRLRGYHAFFVRLEGTELPALPAATPAPPRTGQVLLVHRVAKRGGVRRDQVDVNRVVGKARSYADRLFLSVERSVEEGAVLRESGGAVLGFAAYLQPEERERQLGGRRRRGRDGPVEFPVVAVLFSELGEPATLAERMDTRVMPQEDVEARRLPWLGVEFDGVDEVVAELLDISAPTRDGQRGFLVTVVYADSPAQRIGIEEGDVLLSVRRVSAPGGPPVDLDRADAGYSGYWPSFLPGGAAPAPWRKRSNTLVRLLQDWGATTKYELVWWRDAAEQSAVLEVEDGPAHFDSAARHFDETMGLEVRDLTFEVRHVLRLDAGLEGVVVGRVEPGSPAAQARLLANELVLELGGRPIRDAAAFEEMVEAARKAERDSVRLVVRRLGRSRIVDVRVVDSGEDAAEEEPE